MSDRSDLIVGGYFFGSYEDARIAEKEIKNAQYLNERTSVMSPLQMKTVYDKMIDEKVFSTPVGWEYLKYLKKDLINAGIPEEDIRPVPLYCNFAMQKKDILDSDNSHVAKRRIRNTKKNTRSSKDALKISIIINCVLFILVFAMFVITIKSDNANILNYRQAITDEYASWEQELKDREELIREKEKELENTNSR